MGSETLLEISDGEILGKGKGKGKGRGKNFEIFAPEEQ